MLELLLIHNRKLHSIDMMNTFNSSIDFLQMTWEDLEYGYKELAESKASLGFNRLKLIVSEAINRFKIKLERSPKIAVDASSVSEERHRLLNLLRAGELHVDTVENEVEFSVTEQSLVASGTADAYGNADVDRGDNTGSSGGSEVTKIKYGAEWRNVGGTLMM